MVYSLDTRSPVFVNEKAVTEDGCRLRNGDIIKISDLHFRWMKKVDANDKDES